MKRTIAVAVGAAVVALLVGAGVQQFQKQAVAKDESAALAEVKAILTKAPLVPPPVDRARNAKVVVNIEMVEVKGTLADGVQYNFWTFGGTVPGPFIRVRVGDMVQIRIKNNEKAVHPHSIDLHAVTGPGGGAAVTQLGPGQEGAFEFKALNPGLYVYHCATPSVPEHIANGMYGLILVEPEKGLPRVDREYYVMQGEFYTKGKTLAPGLQAIDPAKLTAERPEYVVFNGKMGALLGDGTVKANVGETVRLFVGNGGPNLISSFHVIGEIFDRVYAEGGTAVRQENVQTTLVPAGGAAIVEFKVEVPGTYILVDHALFRTFNKGALAMLKVDGPDNKLVYSGKEVDETYLGEQAPEGHAAAQRIATLEKKVEETIKQTPAIATMTKEIQVEKGKLVFMQTCAVCHQTQGQGLPQVFPPLASSDFLMADKARSIRIVLRGTSGPISVNGTTYDSVMPPVVQLTDEQVAHVLTYVRNSWGNMGDAVSPDEVRLVREDHK